MPTCVPKFVLVGNRLLPRQNRVPSKTRGGSASPPRAAPLRCSLCLPGHSPRPFHCWRQRRAVGAGRPQARAHPAGRVHRRRLAAQGRRRHHGAHRAVRSQRGQGGWVGPGTAPRENKRPRSRAAAWRGGLRHALRPLLQLTPTFKLGCQRVPTSCRCCGSPLMVCIEVRREAGSPTCCPSSTFCRCLQFNLMACIEDRRRKYSRELAQQMHLQASRVGGGRGRALPQQPACVPGVLGPLYVPAWSRTAVACRSHFASA